MATKKKQGDLIDVVAAELDRQQSVNPLLVALGENDKKNMFKTNVTTAFHKTGFHLFDYYFGSVINIHDEIGNLISQEPRVGQAAGTFNLIIGNTGSGKSTLAIQLAGNIIRQFPYANVIHYDCENRTNISRCENITRLPANYFGTGEGGGIERYMLKGGIVGLDTIQEMIVKTYVNKIKLKDVMMVPSGFKDEFGKDAMIYQPTIIIIDSMATVMNETFNPNNSKEASDAEKMRSNTEGARDAKTVKGFFKDVIPLCKEANIIIYGINHINDNMSMNAFTPVAKQQNYLKQNESIPGGKMMLYIPYNIVKLTAKPGDDFIEDSDGFAGHMVMVEPIKSSSNQSGNNSKGIAFEMVFSHKNGFDPLRSIIMYGRDKGLIEGNKNRMKFKDDDSFTFNLKDIYKEKDEKPIWESINKFIVPTLKDHLSFVEPLETKFDNRGLDY